MSRSADEASPSTLILGGGLTGLATAHRLAGESFRLIERDRVFGGHARSHRREGFTFDVTGHWLHLRDPRSQALLEELFKPGEWTQIERVTKVFSHGQLLEYPFQANLHGLPLEVVQECLVELVKAREAQVRRGEGQEDPTLKNFHDFAVARFGEGIARHFFVPYNKKLWGDAAEKLTAEWVSRFIPLPEVSQIVAGALGVKQTGLGYNQSFSYPVAGGIDHLPQGLVSAIEASSPGCLQNETSLLAVDFKQRKIQVGSPADPPAKQEGWLPYQALVSTIPLNVLLGCALELPEEVRNAAQKLEVVSWRYLDLAVNSEPPEDYHWIYVPEERFPFFRVGIYSNALPAMAPAGCSSLYVELSDREGDLNLEEIYNGLIEIGALRAKEDIKFYQERRVPFAYVVFDQSYRDATKTILSWLETQGVKSCGRYGRWEYNSMEDCLLQGFEAAEWAKGVVS